MLKLFEISLKIGKVPIYHPIHIPPDIATQAVNSKKFNDYLLKLQNSKQVGVAVDKIDIVHIEMFSNRVGFISIRAHTSKDGYPMPSFVFLRGHAVGILFFVNGKLLLVEQFRVPVQETRMEAPAGMIDESGDFVGVAAAQIQEETSIRLQKEDLKPLGSYTPSPGASDEEIFLYYCEKTLSNEALKKVEEKVHGEAGSKERIRVRLVEYTPENILATRDSKLIYAAYAYEAMQRNSEIL